MYGMSECTGPQTANAATPGWYASDHGRLIVHFRFKSQTAGVPLPGTEIFIDHPSGNIIFDVEDEYDQLMELGKSVTEVEMFLWDILEILRSGAYRRCLYVFILGDNFYD